MIKSLSLIFPVLILSFSSFSQASNGTIKGIVTSEAGEKLDAAGVFLTNTKFSALTTSDGSYTMKSVPPGNYHLVCTYLGYRKFEKDISVIGGQTMQVNITLEADAQLIDQVVVIGQMEVNTVQRMPEVEGTLVYLGKRNDVIQMDRQNTNTAQVVARQIFAKVPGVSIWDMDGSGTQINIATRGLNPHRSIEMNVRQDGYNINSDLFGYPEAHYAPTMEGVKKIEVIRGSASLQYGPQFGGMINFMMRDGDLNKKFSYETQQSVGSDALFATFHSIGGTIGKWNYYGYFNYRRSDGYRDYSSYHSYSYFASLKYQFSEKVTAGFDFSRMYYVDQLAGGLTDSMFAEDPYQSTRTRNYFQPNMNIPAFLLDVKLSDNTGLSLKSNYFVGQRNSVMYIAAPTAPDTILASTLGYLPRTVDRDYYNSITNEFRMLHQYSFLKQKNALAFGVRYSDSRTHRQQRGEGTTGTDFDLSLTEDYLTDLTFKTINYAVFAENVFHFGKLFSLSPGARLDVVKTTSTGEVDYLPYGLIYDKQRNIPLVGCGSQFEVSETVNIYANWSQAYKPVLYSDLVPSSTLDVVDQNMEDAKGHQADLGIRGSIKDILRFDAGIYYLYYANRVGTVNLTDSAGNNYIYRTNTGTTEAKGLETFFEFHPMNWIGYDQIGDISIFTSTSTDDAVYLKGNIVTGGENLNIKGNQLENAPDLISRSGLTWSYKKISLTVQYSYVSEVFTDATNSPSSANGITGIVPAYGLFDVNGVFDFGKFDLKAGINNLSNKEYFTRRINTYPGPGILPGDGRTFYVSFSLKV